ncbi:hypothetical protein FUSO6_03265 [Fusobacterium necrophorum DAB]|uniref:Transposase IS204/IS1001/IS1096/IS1165 DDE domain-containing protein n=1 Tax=Fusobacterium necrophorum BL TaxID=1441732 RepID=A0AB73BVE3_9FUSO|nr:transposase [Fusobacterium necrophorum]KDE61685.1 hypothetical protein FUSO3_09730 [Fusobacterium necrophorum BL]KDE70742.1 hypothetical protein FUSO6_03265 [Fusobacterium necrophorum DAB]
MKTIKDSLLVRKLKNIGDYSKNLLCLSEKRYYSYSFRQYLSFEEIVNYFLRKLLELNEYYGIYQDFLQIFQQKKKDIFPSLLEKHKHYQNPQIVFTLRINRKLSKEIVNSLESPFSNEMMQGFNQKIKLIKHISYNYRNFYNLRSHNSHNL